MALRILPFLVACLYLAPPLCAQPRLVTQAVRAFEQQDWAQAQALIDQATAMPAAEQQPCTWYYRGVIYEKLLRNNPAVAASATFLEQTLAAYQKVLELAPAASQYYSFAKINLNGLWEYYLYRGVRYYKQEAFERAIAQFDVCKRLMPKDTSAYLYTGIAAQQEGHYEQALQNYAQYQQLGGKSPAVYRTVAHLTDRHLNDPAQALKILDQALLLYPFSDDLLQEQVRLYTAMDREVDREAWLQAQIAAASEEPAYPYQLAYWYAQDAQLHKALEYYQQAADLAPKQVEPIRQQGAIYYNQAVQMLNKMDALPEEEFQKTGVVLI
ncbi:MAG: hypothetical protein AAFQ78_01845, partial [Bacteroidota bacterium]